MVSGGASTAAARLPSAQEPALLETGRKAEQPQFLSAPRLSTRGTAPAPVVQPFLRLDLHAQSALQRKFSISFPDRS